MAVNTVSTALNMAATTTETLGTSVAGNEAIGSAAGNNTVVHNGYNFTKILDAGSTPPGTQVSAFAQALTAGTATIDLTSLPTTNGQTGFDMTGQKVQVLMVKAPSSNANVITIADGAANGYGGFGASFLIELQPGQQALLYGNDATPDVGGAAKNWDITGTGAQVMEFHIVAG